jgi:hypothetical protein
VAMRHRHAMSGRWTGLEGTEKSERKKKSWCNEAGEGRR